MADDRRRIPRVPVFFVLERISRAEHQVQEDCQGVVKNITPDGMLLETSLALNKNDLLQVSFTLPTAEAVLNLEAKVRWCERQKAWSIAGLEFMDLAAEQREIIMDYLVSLGPEL